MKIINASILEMLFQVKFDYLKKTFVIVLSTIVNLQTVIDNRLNNLSDDIVARIPKFKQINFHTYQIVLYL